MKCSRFLPVALVGVVTLALNACTLLREANSGSDEQTLIAAGFQARTAETPQQLTALKALPPYKVVPQQDGGRVGYVYAAPNESMLYVGSPAEYRKYQQLSIKEDIAEENEMAAMDNEMAAQDWDWNMWGPYWW